MKLVLFLVIVALIASSTSSPVREVKLDDASLLIVTPAKVIDVSSTQASPTTVKNVSTTAGEEDEDEDEYADPDPDDGISNSAILSLVG